MPAKPSSKPKATKAKAQKRAKPARKLTKSGKPSQAGQMGDKKGRPTGYTPALGRAICKMLAMGMSLNEICQRPRIKARTSERRVRSWAIDPTHAFSPNYARAREEGYHKMAEEIFAIADDGRNDVMRRRNQNGDEVETVDNEVLARSRLRVETRKWFLSKALPKIYGDKTFSEVSGPNGGPIQTQDTTPQSTGVDHLAKLGARFGAHLTVIEGGKKRA